MKTKEEKIVVELRMIKYLLIVIALVLMLIAGILNAEVMAIVLPIVLAVSLLGLLIILILRKPAIENTDIGRNESRELERS